MKNKSAWELKPNESIYSKTERDIIRIDSKYKNQKTFLCFCGKRHSWKDLGKKH